VHPDERVRDAAEDCLVKVTTHLARGGEEPARIIVERFLGRPVSNEAFFAEITGKR
jgi:hypothetical protein